MDEFQTARGTDLLRERLRRRSSGKGEPVGIPALPRESGMPLSSAQRRLWILDQLRPGGADYLVPIVLRLRGRIDVERMSAALNALVARHEVLRTRYEVRGGEAVQLLDDQVEVPLQLSEVDGGGSGDPEPWRELVAADLAAPFDLHTGPVLRARLIRLDDQDHVLCLVIHHIAVDGWASDLLIGELTACYDAPGSLPPVSVQYADAARWQELRAPDEQSAQVRAWLGGLAGLPTLDLPLDRPRPPLWDPAAGSVAGSVGAATAHRLRELARRHDGTPFIGCLAGIWALLGRYSGQEDFAVGTVAARRTHPLLESVVGSFINLLPLRADLSGSPSFRQLLERARSTAVDAYTHQDVPFESLVSALGAERDLSSHPVFGVNVVWQSVQPRPRNAAGLEVSELEVDSATAKFDLTWALSEQGDGSIQVVLTFATALFERESCAQMVRRFVRLVEQAVAAPDLPLAEIDLLADGEFARLIHPPVVTPAVTSCLHQRFDEHARRGPDAVAIRHGGANLTYAEVNTRANRLAHRLVQLGAGGEQLVAICLPRGADLVVAILAVLKSGAGYLPTDPDLPRERIAFMLRDTRACVMITTTDLAERVRPETQHVVRLDDPDEIAGLAAQPVTAPEVVSTPDQLAYTIYTSGSTGEPKGVAVTHANVVRLHDSTAADYSFGADDRWLLFHSYAFDVSVWEMWGAFLYGGALVVVDTDTARSPEDLLDLLVDERITVLNQTPSAFAGLIDAVRGEHHRSLELRLRWVVLAGEPVDVARLEPWWRAVGDQQPQVINKYGITETTVHSTFRRLSLADLRGDRSPIGRPIDDTALYVLDERQRPVAGGMPGEICVGGPGVTRGYWGRPSLTAQRFVPDPFGPAGARMYRSGDRARVLADGDIGFLGRFDQQIKIRGFRVEIGEIEAALSSQTGVDQAVVTLDEPKPGEKRLLGYVVLDARRAPTLPQLRTALRELLPAYMVPARLISLDRLPLTINGKLDRRALPQPDAARPEQDANFVAPSTPAQAAVTQIWEEVLDLESVGIDDNFFALGGDSIRAVRLVGRLRETGHGVTVQDVFRHQTVRELAAQCGGCRDEVMAAPVQPFELLNEVDRSRLPDGLRDSYPMSIGQAGMAYEFLADPDRHPYHNITSYLIRDDAEFDAHSFRGAAQDVIDRHETLRTSFDLSSYSEPLQLVHAYTTASVQCFDLRSFSVRQQAARLHEYRQAERSNPFNLTTPPLVRFAAHHVDRSRWYLSLVEFHAVLDGWSHNSLITELLETYRARREGRAVTPTPGASVRFADFVAQERASLASGVDREFWSAQLRDAKSLPIPSGWSTQREGSVIEHEQLVDISELLDRLSSLAARCGTSLKSVLLAAHIAVWRTVGGDRFYSGLVCNGRTETAGGDQVRGMFLNTVPFVSPVADTWLSLVRAVFDAEVALLPHRRYPLSALQREFNGNSRMLDVAFNYLDFHVLDRSYVDADEILDESPNEFPFALTTLPGLLVLTARPEWIDRPHLRLLARAYRRVLTAMATDPDGPARCSWLSPDQRNREIELGRGPSTSGPTALVHDLVLERARRQPHQPALADDQRTLTYAQLVDRAGEWTAALQQHGVRGGDLVGLCLPHGADFAAALLGVLGAGAAYVPLAPGQPVQRLVELLDQSEARVVVTTDELASALATRSRPSLCPDAVRAGSGPGDPVAIDADDLAYVVYTSGSTGRPKGVMVTHAGLANRIASFRRITALRCSDALAAVVPPITDVAQLDLLAPLVVGARVAVAEIDCARDPQALRSLLAREPATIAQAAPVTWRLLWDTGWRPEPGFRAVSGGETLPGDLARRLVASGAEVWDAYGPNEATIFSFASSIGPDGAARQWLPADDTDSYLLDTAGEPVPSGVHGELYLSGAGLARGYLGGAATTAASFVPDPHALAPGARMFRTGDLARRGPTGTIHVVGRIDGQVKVHGLRVEMAEVEAALLTHPGVRAAVVQPVGIDGEQIGLTAWTTFTELEPSAGELRAYLLQRLPEHMVPTRYASVPRFPTLPNGKVDRSALRESIPAQRPSSGGESPVGRHEQAVAATWRAALDLPAVGRTDDFFALGGHSLLMMRVIASLRADHGLEVSFRDFLDRRTVMGIADAAATGSGDEVPHSALLPLSSDIAATARSALYCLHPGGGSGHWYRTLAAELRPHHAVTAFEWPGLHGPCDPVGGVGEIADRYLAELLDDQPTGTYHLLGWCGSSGIAWEMARRLRERGSAVRLILLDPVVDLSTSDRSAHETKRDLFAKAEQLLRGLDDLDEPNRSAARVDVAETLREVVDDGDVPLVPDDVGPIWTHRLRTWRELLEARLDYSFATYEGDVDLVVCDELAVSEQHEAILGQTYVDYVAGWRDRCRGTLRIHSVPGDHLGVLRQPHVRDLAAVIARILTPSREVP